MLDLLPVSRNLEKELELSTSNIDTPDSEGRTPLSWAAECGNPAAVETLLSYHANISTTSITGDTPLHYAAKAPTPDCLSILVKNGASVQSKNKWGQGLLGGAYFHNDPAYIIPVLDKGADMHERDCYGSCALSSALFMNNDKAARCLISRGANISDPDKPGATSINNAIENNSHECIALMLDSEANLAMLDPDDNSVLHILASRGDLRSIEMFQSGDLDGLNAEAKNKAGHTACDMMDQRVDVSDEVQGAFRRLMARLDSKSNCVIYFDALEKMPPVAGKIPDLVEVKVEEIVVE